MNIPPLQSTGSFMPNKQYKLFNYWAIINGIFLSLVYGIYFWGGISARDKIIPPTLLAAFPPIWQKMYSYPLLMWNLIVLLYPVILALLFFGILIWFSCYKRYSMMPSILVYGSIAPILALYIWRCFITVIETSKMTPPRLDTKTYFYTLFHITR